MSEQFPGVYSEQNNLGGNIVKEIECPTLGSFGLGRGSIGGEGSIDTGSREFIELVSDLDTGVYSVKTDATIPGICIDGRLLIGGDRIPLPATAGGVQGVAYASDLASSSIEVNESEVSLIAKTTRTLLDKGHQVAAHSDDHADCGCGAVAKAPDIYTNIANDTENIFAVSTALGFSVDEELGSRMSARASNRAASNEFFAAEGRAAALKAATDEGAGFEELVGSHAETLIVWNMRDGERINTEAIKKATGKEVFVVDAWTFKHAAAEMNTSGYAEETQAIASAFAVYNIATADKLCAAEMPVLVLS